MKRLLSLTLLALPFALILSAPQAQAQRFVIGVGGHSSNSKFGVSAQFRFGQPRYGNPPIIVAPPRCEAAPVWVPGHYELVSRKVWQPGRLRQEYVPAVYRERHWRDYRGNWHVERVQTCAATWRTVEEPGTWQLIDERIWIEGSWRKYAS
jgi:hypothetical protein